MTKIPIQRTNTLTPPQRRHAFCDSTRENFAQRFRKEKDGNELGGRTEKTLERLSASLRDSAGGRKKLWLVGATGFEPATPASRTQCATGLRYAPTKSTEPQSEGGLSYIRGAKRKPWASATPRQVILPPDRFTPFASPASARTAGSTRDQSKRSSPLYATGVKMHGGTSGNGPLK